jgi:hypothetical protein
MPFIYRDFGSRILESHLNRQHSGRLAFLQSNLFASVFASGCGASFRW